MRGMRVYLIGHDMMMILALAVVEKQLIFSSVIYLAVNYTIYYATTMFTQFLVAGQHLCRLFALFFLNT
jgi:hypothetical protein